MKLLIEFEKLEKEQNLIGQMLMAYGELEFAIAGMIGRVIGDNDQGGRLFFRVHGEAARLDVADAILRPFFINQSLSGQWGNTIGALRYCKNVRNQYAHCNWQSKPDGTHLAFFNMDVDAASPEGMLMLSMHPVDLPLIEKQYAYFEYCSDWVYFLGCKTRKAFESVAPDPIAPKSIPQPPLSNRPKKPPVSPEACTTPKGRPVES